MKKKFGVYQIYCEWDIGQEYNLFETYTDAEQYVLDWFGNEDMMEVYGVPDIETLFDDGLLDIAEIKVLGV